MHGQMNCGGKTDLEEPLARVAFALSKTSLSSSYGGETDIEKSLARVAFALSEGRLSKQFGGTTDLEDSLARVTFAWSKRSLSKQFAVDMIRFTLLSTVRFRPCISGIRLFSYAWFTTEMGWRAKEDIPRVAKKRVTLLGRTYIFVGNNDVTAAVRRIEHSLAQQL